MGGIRETLIEELERKERAKENEEIRDLLVMSLAPEEVDVFDARPRQDEITSGVETTARKGRREEDECKAKDPKKCWKHGFAADILKEDRKSKDRKKDRLNPQPTEALQELQDLGVEVREVGWNIKDPPDNKADTEAMLTDIDSLRKEAGIKKINDSFEPYRQYRKAWEDYLAIKKESEKLLKVAQGWIDKKDARRAKEALASLKERPTEIENGYQKVVEAYEATCDALCEIIDRKSSTDGVGNPLISEVAKQGFGLLDGESSEDYQKRMKKVGRGKEIPETIKKIDGIVKETERRWRSVAGISEDEFNIVKKNWQQSIHNLMKRCSLASNLKIAGLNGVLEGHLKSQHDLAKKGKKYEDGILAHKGLIGGDETCSRYRFSRRCFGVEKGLAEGKYEKYGCLHTISPSKEDARTGGQYGSIVVRWKPENTVATMTCTDSLCLAREDVTYCNPCLVSNPSPCCFNPANQDAIETLKKGPMNIGLDSMCNMFGTPYIELQLHGEQNYNAEAISSIAFSSEDDIRNLSRDAREQIEKNRIPIYIGSKKGSLDKFDKDTTIESKHNQKAIKPRLFTSDRPIQVDAKGNIINLGKWSR